jgi:N-methylhydantoinase A/oxoprolinase/acetone carboxylase beta subunit
VREVEIAVDTGGTFTDCVVRDCASGEITGFKVLSTPHDPSVAIFNALQLLLGQGGVTTRDISAVLHATTVATNALIERKGSKVGLITTDGFRDILELRRETRYDEVDLFPVFPAPLVARHLRLGVSERVDSAGKVVAALDKEHLRARLRELQQRGVETVAVSFLHSYVNPDHELAAARIATEEFTFDALSISCEVQPEIREYERTSTTVANAFIQKKVRDYVTGLKDGLADRGIDASLQIMQSNGGFAGAEATSQFPVRMVESGPAAGTISAIFHGRRAGYQRLVSFDMGGTTAKIAVLTGETPPLVNELEVARVHRFKVGSGIPLRCPSVALNEIGAGGGSIAAIDGVGLMRVGPESAGASPGPVCYGQGGTEPTVTDADLILGYLDPGYFAGGSIRLDKEAAERAVSEKLAARLGLTLEQTAWGIHDIVNQNMAAAARLHILEQGEDPAQFAMVAFGGAGPVHAHRVAQALGIRTVIYPIHAGVASAFGLMVAPMTTNFVQTYKTTFDAIDWERFEGIFGEMEVRAARTFAREATQGLTCSRSIDFRYLGQGFEVQLPLPSRTFGKNDRAELETLMRGEYARIFGRVVEGVAFEIVNLRLIARAERGGRALEFALQETAATPAKKGSRRAYFDEKKRFVETTVYDRHALSAGTTIGGPAIIEEKDTTIIVPPGATAVIDALRNVIVTLP